MVALAAARHRSEGVLGRSRTTPRARRAAPARRDDARHGVFPSVRPRAATARFGGGADVHVELVVRVRRTAVRRLRFVVVPRTPVVARDRGAVLPAVAARGGGGAPRCSRHTNAASRPARRDHRRGAHLEHRDECRRLRLERPLGRRPHARLLRHGHTRHGPARRRRPRTAARRAGVPLAPHVRPGDDPHDGRRRRRARRRHRRDDAARLPLDGFLPLGRFLRLLTRRGGARVGRRP